MTEPIAFIPGQSEPETGLLSRYLPPLPIGIVSTWLKEHLPAGAWVIDPFGADPDLAAEAARAGYRVLVAANNPIARFLLEMAAKPLTEVELQSALADLAATRKGEERLELNIRGLYQSKCAACGNEVNVEAFLWERNASAPYAKIYQCQNCGEAGEYLTSDEDISRSKRFSESSLHHARALERVTSRDDPDRNHVEDALSVYLPRAVYALFTLVNKVESLIGTQARLPSGFEPAQSTRQRALFALLLSAFDQTNTLWAHPVARARPRQLTVPPHFRENNVWLALEESIPLIASTEDEVPLATWPETPPLSGGISIFEGRLKDLGVEKEGSRLERIDFQAVLAALPRPNQAFWTLSALWAGWLWGRDALGPFKSVLRRRRYDWAWHTTALQAAASILLPLLSETTLFFGLIGELEPGFLASALLGEALGGFELQGLALRTASDQAQLTWKSQGIPSQSKTADLNSKNLIDVAVRSGFDYLNDCGEPSDYLCLQAAALEKIIGLGLPSTGISKPPAEVYAQIQDALENAFGYRYGFVRFGGNEKSLEAGKWWLRKDETVTIPLKDRVEMALVRWL